MHCSPIQLSPREHELIGARARGLPLKQIAAESGITLNTVKTHFQRIFKKLDIQCSLQLLQRMQLSECEACPYYRQPLTDGRSGKLAAIVRSGRRR